MMMNLQPIYIEGIEIEVNSLRNVLNKEDYGELVTKCNGVAYHYPSRGIYSHRKRLPELVDTMTGEIN